MAWDEWEQLKARVAERHSAQMQLNQYPADAGGGAGGAVKGAGVMSYGSTTTRSTGTRTR